MLPTKPNKAVTAKQIQELRDLIPQMHLHPGEDATAFAHLREAFLDELGPSKPYQAAIADNIVALEWEIHRHRQLVASLIRSSFRAVAQGMKDEDRGFLGAGDFVSDEAKEFADALMGARGSDQEAAYAWLTERNIDIAEIHAEAYGQAATRIEPHERKLSELETRRRRLRDDYNALRKTRADHIPDAQIVDPE